MAASGAAVQVLVVEDNPADVLRVREALEEGGHGRFEATVVGRLADAAAQLAGADIVLLDLTLPDSRGADTVERLRRKAPRTPVVVLSGHRDEETAFRCLQHGAQDVLLKGSVQGDALVRAISCALERQSLARERDEALARARAGEADLRRILDAAREGLVVADARGRALFVNPAAAELLGWEPGEAEGRPLDLPLDTPWPVEEERSGPDGRPVVLEVRSAAITWEGAPATLSSIHDVSGLRPREPGPRQAAATLVAPGEGREASRRLAAGIARSLKEQVRSVLDAALALADGPDAAVQGPALEIQRAGWAASGLVRDLLACAGESRLLPEDLDLTEVVTAHWDRVQERITDPVVARRDLAAGLPRVHADRRLLEQALLVLVEHARDAMPGGGALTVRTFRVPGNPERVALSVTDQGPGVGPGDLAHLLEPFYTSEVLGIGAGLGLAPVEGIALQSGGCVEVKSHRGQGTTVRILLPVGGRGETGDRPAGAAILRAPGEGSELPRGRETILLALSDPWLRGRIGATLQELGYRVLAAPSAGDAIRIAHAFGGGLALLLADQRAVGMGGEVLAGVLRCRRPALRALLLGDGGAPRVPAGDEAPATRLLRRPFGRRDLALALRAALDSPAHAPTPPAPG